MYKSYTLKYSLFTYILIYTFYKDFILKRIQPYLNEKNMLGEEDFEELFSILSLHQKYEIIELLIEEGIEIDYENRKIEK